MNAAAELLSELTTRGVVIAPAAGACLELYPRSALSPDLLARVRMLKPQLLELLRARADAVASPAEWKVLAGLALKPELSPSELAFATHLEPAATNEAIRRLSRRAEIDIGPEGRLTLKTV
jgi:hypothetical protein